VQLQTLGGLALHGSSLGRPKPLLLLTYLALEGAKDRHHLAELFWPDAAEPMNSLRVALAHLRAAAPGSFENKGTGLTAEVEADAVALLRALDARELVRATELYRGAFLEGFYLAGIGSELEEWVYSTREFLGGRVREAWLGLAERDAAVGDFRAAARRAEAALKLPGAPPPEPEGLERLYRLLVAGDSPRARDLQKEARSYGLDLSFTQDEARRHLQPSGERSAGGSPHNLPLRATSFVGRDPELIELAKLLADPDTRLITLVGVGGVGKTRLALQAAHGEVQGGRFEGGVYFIPLDALTDPGLIPAEIARALGVGLPGLDRPLVELTQALAGRRLLLLLDNFEHLMAGADVLSTLLTACLALKLLVTSRERLNLEGEQLFQVEGLPLPRMTLTPEEAAYGDAVQLFVQRSKRVKLDFTLDERTLPHVLRICRLLEGSPLGLELAAASLRLMPVADVAAEIERGLDLSTQTRDVPGRHRSLRATFEHSWRLLTDKEQEVLRRLSVFVGGFTREAAARVAGASIPLLASLVDKSLLRVLEGGRYDRHPLIYGYAREKLSEHPEEEAEVRARHASYFLELAEEAETQLKGAAQAACLNRLEAEHDNLRAALRYTQERGEVQLGLRLAGALWQFWYVRGHLSEGRMWLTESLSGGGVVEPSLERAKVLSGVGTLAFYQGDYASARAFHEESLALRRVLKDSWGVAGSLHDLGNVAALGGDTFAAKRFFEESLALKRALGDKRGLAASLNNLGNVLLRQGEEAAARALCEESAAVRRALGDKQGLAVSLSNLGNIVRKQGDNDAARGFYEESLAIRRELGDKQGIAIATNNLGLVAQSQGDYSFALLLFQESLSLEQELGDKSGIAHSLEAFANLAVAQRQPRKAARFWGAAERLRETIGAPLPPFERTEYERDVASAQAQLSKEAFATAWAEGRTMSLEEAVTFALELPAAPPPRAQTAPQNPST